jgi:hypothetical protein
LFAIDDKSVMLKALFNIERTSCSVFSSIDEESKCVAQIINESKKAMFV